MKKKRVKRREEGRGGKKMRNKHISKINYTKKKEFYQRE